MKNYDENQQSLTIRGWPIMGHGRVAVGICRNSIHENLHGIIYLPLPEAREINADTSDIYPPRSLQENPLACIYFETAESIDQTIEVLEELKQMIKHNLG